ncbi:MAG: sulfatase [Verrucomicrobiota bacterium]
MKNIWLHLLTGLLAATSFSADQPNVIFILVDDLGHADVGFNGSTYFETPHIDALADSSLILDQAYMYPTCSPSRVALFTGKQSFRTGVYTVPVLEKGTDQENIFSRWTLPREHEIYAQLMQRVGYRSIHLGKWHIVGPYPLEESRMEFPLTKKLSQPDPFDFSWVETHRSPEGRKYYPEGRGFLKNVGGTYRGDPALEDGGYKNPKGGYHAPFSNPFIEPKPGDEWLTDRLTDDAIEFMEEHRESPFLINLHYYTVHRPIVARNDDLLQKYLDKPGCPKTGQGMEPKRRETHASYATMVESLDDNVGKIVSFLEENDLRENTVIFFTSDNGQNGSQSANVNLRASKGSIYEGGIRVPTFVNWSGRVEARRTSTPVGVLDFFPTLLELADVDGYEGPMDGDSLVPMFTGDDSPFVDRSMHWHIASRNKHGTCSVLRKGDYKLIQFLASGELELYNLAEDPKEEVNLASANPELADQLLEELVEWRKENEVPLPPNAVMEQ